MTRIISLTLLTLLGSVGFLFSQVKPSSPEKIHDAIEKRKSMATTSIFKDFPARSIGPVVQGARISDLAVSKVNPRVFYVAYASGGIFKTVNNGISFEPVFDNQGALTIGAIAMAPGNEEVIYVGTGENNSSRSSYAGSGVYKSKDAGKTWQHIGLDNIQHTGEIIVHPEDADVVYVAAMGALYSKNKERGIYKSIDGGASWKHVLYVNDSTGAMDIILNPQNSKQMWATTWERARKPWDFKENGPGSGIYRSMDGGDTWQQAMAGLPDGPVNGRIGLDIVESQPNILYALVDNQTESRDEKKAEDDKAVISVAKLLKMRTEDFAKLKNEDLDNFLRENNFPERYDAIIVKKEILEGKYTPKVFAEYFGGANANLFNTTIAGAEVYRSDDFGKSWVKTNTYALEGVYYTYGYYFGEIRVNPKDADELFILGVPLLKSTDGGKTFARTDTIGRVHADQQAMWINPKDPAHIILGNDGGLYLSYDAGATWLHVNNTSVGQFYTVNVDMAQPYHVYGGLQDNGVLTGSSKSVPNEREDWENIMGGDGMFVAPDPRNSSIVYTGYQFGNYYRIDRKADKNKYITPKQDIGDDALRFNWRTPLLISKHNADILYIGAQKVFRSLDRGDSWEAISEDLTRNLPQGDVPYSTIASLAESPLQFGLIYAGSDDGKLHVTKNGGATWELISASLPQDLWVSSVFPSPHDKATVFASLTGYRFDDFTTYMYKSIDYGKTWTSLKGNLPDEAVNVIVQDPVNPLLLYAGTDHGTYISLDGGQIWDFVNAVPNVSSYDMIVHPRENELVIATHGRSMYILDVKPMQAIKAGDSKNILVYDPEPMSHSTSWGTQTYPWMKPYTPSVKIMYYLPKRVDQIKADILDEKGNVLQSIQASGEKGFQTLSWDLKQQTRPKKKGDKSADSTYVGKGTYKVKMTVGKSSDEAKIEVK